METNLGQLFLRGGWVMWPLLIFSVLSWAVILERLYTYITLRPKLAELAAALINSLKSGDLASARQICLAGKPQVNEIFVTALETKRPRDWPKE